MDVAIRKWGNSQGIRIPKSVLEELDITIEDKLDLEVMDGKIIITKAFRHKTFEERVAEYGKEVQFYKYDWGEDKGREVF